MLGLGADIKDEKGDSDRRQKDHPDESLADELSRASLLGRRAGAVRPFTLGRGLSHFSPFSGELMRSIYIVPGDQHTLKL